MRKRTAASSVRREPQTRSEVFEAYTRAVHEAVQLQSELERWQRANPQGDPRGLLANYIEACQRRDALGKRFDELKKTI